VEKDFWNSFLHVFLACGRSVEKGFLEFLFTCVSRLREVSGKRILGIPFYMCFPACWRSVKRIFGILSTCVSRLLVVSGKGFLEFLFTCVSRLREVSGKRIFGIPFYMCFSLAGGQWKGIFSISYSM
jgi:hypothetical protein